MNNVPDQAQPPRPVLHSARVLEYAVLGDGVAYTGRKMILVDGTPLGPARRLAILSERECECPTS